MNKILGIILLIAISLMLFTGCFEKIEPNTTSGEKIVTPIEEERVIVPIYKEFDYEYSFDDAFSKIQEVTNLTAENKLSNEDVENYYSISELEGVEYDIRKNNNYEVAIIKLKDTNQSAKAFEMISARAQSLNLSEEKYSAEQNQGIMTIVFGENASKINEELTKVFSEI